MTSAVVQIYDKEKRLIRCRSLLDTCSTANFITENLAKTLGLPKEKFSVPVGALHELSTSTKHVIRLTFRSIHNKFEKILNFLTIPCISGRIPNEPIQRELLEIPSNLLLADPEFHKPAPVDLLLGSGPTLSLFCIGQINLSNKNQDLYLQKTRLGWVIGGDIGYMKNSNKLNCHLANLQFEVNRFWEIEEGQTKYNFSPEELECEKYFQQTVSRNEEGRYIVALPFKQNPDKLGESRSKALKRLNSLTNKFVKYTEFEKAYSDVINEYKDLNHATEVKISSGAYGFYLPHHAVIKESSMTTKVRPVFNASLPSSSGLSLNDLLTVGPTVQDDIVSLVLRFRLHNYVISADIEKMYRQVLIRKEDRKYQRILWKEADEIKTYELNTVTFGVSAAPFLAIRCLYQLAEDEGQNYPAAVNILKNDFYVDNLLTGAETIESAIQKREEITQLLRLGGFNLRQWAANDMRILNGIDKTDIIPNLQFDKEQTLNTLGVMWDAKNDCIVYTITPVNAHRVKSKRAILSEIAKIFDPLGLLGPIILYAKKIMQKLWLLKLDWGESVPSNEFTVWMDFCNQLNSINHVSFERKILKDDFISVQLHGFSDASEGGYGACLYLRSEDESGRVQSTLLYAKSRVAPLKTVSLPRLELCGAQILAKISNQVKEKIDIKFQETVLWTDSSITLHWINTSPHMLKTFVANRVADIQHKSKVEQWRHVRSIDNPADALSRGQLPHDFLKNAIWREGPSWLAKPESQWPQLALKFEGNPLEQKRNTCLVTSVKEPEIFQKFSSFSALKFFVACCFRFKNFKDAKITGPLTIKERKGAEIRIIKIIQQNAFADVIRLLQEGKEIDKTSNLLNLDPFIDDAKILRVGGRLKNSDLVYSQRHPILLPKAHHVTDLIIRYYHEQNYHSGIQNTLYAIRQNFWITDGRNQVRRIIGKCVRCYRVNPSTVEYKMGGLPKEKKFRNRNKIKVYVSVFVCLVVKAIHLEVVSDLTTDGFLAALKRFVSRRGKPKSIFSDNGTNFVGANNQLREIFALFNSNEHQRKCHNFLGDKGIEWHFIPPLSPHFGGTWESGVKSFKHHLKRVITDELFTFEQFNTFVIEVEGILNSRPLTPVSTDPNDLLVLTPGHFLVGDPLTSLPDPDFTSIPSNRLSTWQHLQKLRQHFWSRWYKEYLNELNIRNKWVAGKHNIKEGTVVLLKDDNLPPMQWSLGRVVKTHPGEDGVVRTATVKTATGELMRSVKKLSPLPIDENDDTK